MLQLMSRSFFGSHTRFFLTFCMCSHTFLHQLVIYVDFLFLVAKLVENA